jgi:hypothetical protein
MEDNIGLNREVALVLAPKSSERPVGATVAPMGRSYGVASSGAAGSPRLCIARCRCSMAAFLAALDWAV